MRKGLQALLLGTALTVGALNYAFGEETSEENENHVFTNQLSLEEVKEYTARLSPLEKKSWLMIAKYHNIAINPDNIDMEKANEILAKVDNGDAGRLSAAYNYKGDVNNNGIIDFDEAQHKEVYSNEEYIDFILEVRSKHIGKKLVFRLFDIDKQKQMGIDIRPEISSRGKIARKSYKPGSLPCGYYLCAAFVNDVYLAGSGVEIKSKQQIELDDLREKAKEIRARIDLLEQKNKK